MSSGGRASCNMLGLMQHAVVRLCGTPREAGKAGLTWGCWYQACVSASGSAHDAVRGQKQSSRVGTGAALDRQEGSATAQCRQEGHSQQARSGVALQSTGVRVQAGLWWQEQRSLS